MSARSASPDAPAALAVLDAEPEPRAALDGVPQDDVIAVPRPRRGFMPTRKHLAYLECWLDPTQPKNMSQIARALGISRRTIAGWLQQDDFRAWFTEEMDRHIDHHWTPALLKVTQLAIAGSAEHFKLLAQVRGALRSESDQRVGVQVIVGIPRPGDHVPVPADAPRPGLPPATSEQDH